MIGEQTFGLVGGVLLEPLGDHWAAYSPASGETHMLNDTSAAVLEVLVETPNLTLKQACAFLAEDAGIPAAELEPLVSDALRAFVTAGLARVVPAAQAQVNITS